MPTPAQASASRPASTPRPCAQTAAHFSPFDLIAVLALLVAWAGMGLIIERETPERPSTHMLMRDYRMRWMEQMVTREPRVFDMIALTGLRQGGSFFASACMISIGGGIALLGQAERLAGLATDISTDFAAPLIVWETKIFLIVLILAYALLKFIWAILSTVWMLYRREFNSLSRSAILDP